MSLKLKEFCNIIEKYVPCELKEQYDNVGLMVGNEEQDITSILVALDCTFEVINEAKEKKCELIFTHHPLLFNKPSSITTETPIGKKIITMIENNISLYSSHTNLDVVKDGLNDIIMKILGFDEYEVLQSNPINYKGIESGTGRIAYIPEGIKLSDLCLKVKSNLNLSNLRYAGEEGKVIYKIGVINGSGEDLFDICRAKGVDCIITGDTKYHHVCDMVEEGICVIDGGHFGTEWPLLKEFSNTLKTIFSQEKVNCNIIMSEKSKDIYKYK